VISKKCGVCGGKKIHDDLETLNVKINRGIRNGERITLSGSASDYVDQLASDLVFVVH
jgi:DnaJ-class molecular chaperone